MRPRGDARGHAPRGLVQELREEPRLQEFKELLRLRSLLAAAARGSAHTPEVVARLFGARAARTRPSTRRHPAPPRGVPDPIFWKVVEYWRLVTGGGLDGAGP